MLDWFKLNRMHSLVLHYYSLWYTDYNYHLPWRKIEYKDLVVPKNAYATGLEEPTNKITSKLLVFPAYNF